ncbi:MAG: hypothetical protein SFZ24_09525, partial [Planctomycetota bacterium]|nr:hypothetical protein [Planctomycetota bacterium]
MERRFTVGCWILLCAGTWTAAGAPRGTATFTPLPDLDGGSLNCSASAVSADGSTIVGFGTNAQRTEAVRWRNDIPEPLGVLPGRTTSNAIELSGDGAIIVGSSGPFPSSLAFRWEAGLMTEVPILPGSTSNSANAISRDGRVISGWSYNTAGFTAFRYENASLSVLSDIPGGVAEDSAVSAAINFDGSIIAGRGRSPGFFYEACRWVAPSTAAIPMGDLAGGAAHSEIDAMNADGSVMVGYANSAQQSGGLWGEAARWVNNGPAQSLGDLPGGSFNGYAFGVSDNGNTIVGYSNTSLGNEAFIWNPESGIRNLRLVLEADFGLDLSGWLLTIATDVSADGRTIVGVGTNPAGQPQAWVVRFAPPFCPGDANGDGAVDFADIVSVLANWS